MNLLLWIIFIGARKNRRQRRGTLLATTAHCHTHMFSFNHNRHAPRFETILNGVSHLRSNAFLCLQSLGKNIHDPRNFGKSKHTAIGQLAYMGLSDNRHHVVLAVRMERNVTHYDHIVVTRDFLKSASKFFCRILIIPGKQLG